MKGAVDIESLARMRLRSLRLSSAYSLEELAARTNLSPSTISRLETGKRSLSLDVVVPLARALQVSLDVLFEEPADEDIVIRPVGHQEGGRTTWPLSRPGGRMAALKMRLEPTRTPPELRAHPGHDWVFVLEGRLCLWLGQRRVEISEGEAAEFPTMTPHGFSAESGPTEALLIFDRDGHSAHVHH